MAHLDADTVGKHAVRLGVVTPEHVVEGMEDIGNRHGDASEFLRALERKGYVTGWQSQKLLKGDTTGYFLGGYRLLYKIASGSFGRVYRADDPRSGTVVAIKVLRQRWTDNAKSIDMFEREGKMGMTMQHPNIVEILSVNCDSTSKHYYIVMEFVEGGNLRDFLKIRTKLSPRETLGILEDTAEGLVYAYGLGISHRDMKMTNVLISSTGRAKLVDFGLAQLSQQVHAETGPGEVDRTVDYAGLEKATGVEHGDTRSDIYFLGCVAYELLTGRSPLERSRNQFERMRRERFERVMALTVADVDGPPSVIHMVNKMMALEPRQRYQTPSQLLDAIRIVQNDIERGVVPEEVLAEDGDKKNVGDGKSIFVLENDPNLQDALRERFKKMGFRVLMSGDPTRALERYKQQPFDALVLDCGTIEEDGLFIFERIIRDAKITGLPLAGVVILSKHQADWQDRIEERPNVAVMVRPVSAKQLQRQLTAVMKPRKADEPTS